MPRVTISIKDKQAQPYRFPLDREKVTLGRGSDNDITINSGSVSVHHAKMIRVPGGYELCDLESTNGLKFDDEKVDMVKLKHGMTVRVGDAEFFFQLSDEEISELKAEGASTSHVKEDKDEKEDKKERAEKEEDKSGDRQEKQEKREEKKEEKRGKKDDDDEDEEDERARKKAKKRAYENESSDWDEDSKRSRPSSREGRKSSGGGSGLFLVFLILAAIAFCVGVAIRFQQETGKSLIDTIRARVQPAEAPASGQDPAQEPPSTE